MTEINTFGQQVELNKYYNNKFNKIKWINLLNGQVKLM